MRNRSPILILGIGIAGLVALGLMTKFALESNPSLLKLGKIKEAIAEDFSSRGVETVGVRALPRRRGFDLRIEAPRGGLADPEGLAKDVAEAFILRYPGPAPASLKLTLIEPGGGCRGPATYFEKEVRVLELKTELELRAALDRMAAAIAGREGFRMRPMEPREPLRIAVDVPKPPDDGELGRTVEFLRGMAREHLAAGSARTVTIEVRTGPGSPVLKEETLEPYRAFRRKRPAPAPAGPGTGSPSGPKNNPGPKSLPGPKP